MAPKDLQGGRRAGAATDEQQSGQCIQIVSQDEVASSRAPGLGAEARAHVYTFQRSKEGPTLLHPWCKPTW